MRSGLLVVLAGLSLCGDWAKAESPYVSNRPQQPKVFAFKFIYSETQLPQYPGWNPMEVLEASLNYFINQQSTHGELCLGGFKGQTFKSPSTVTLNLKDKACFPDEARSIYADYPYACSSNDPQDTFRFDWMVYKLLIQDNYHKADRVPASFEEVLKEAGVDIRFSNTDNYRKVLAVSSVARDQRSLTIVSDQKGVPRALATYDFNRENKRGADADFSANPINAEVEAAEVFFMKPNGLWKYLLLDLKNNKRLNSAPGGVADFNAGISAARVSSDSLAVRSHADFVSIRNGVDCMICHMDGTLSDGYSSVNKEIVRGAADQGVFEDPQVESFVRKMYNVPKGRENDEQYQDDQAFEAQMAKINETFRNTLKKMGAMKGDTMHPFLPDVSALYLENVTFSKLVSELGRTENEVIAAVNTKPDLRALLGMPKIGTPAALKYDPRSFTMARTVFEARFCAIRAQFTGEAVRPKKPLNAPVAQTQPKPPQENKVAAAKPAPTGVVLPQNYKTAPQAKPTSGVVVPLGGKPYAAQSQPSQRPPSGGNSGGAVPAAAPGALAEMSEADYREYMNLLLSSPGYGGRRANPASTNPPPRTTRQADPAPPPPTPPYPIRPGMQLPPPNYSGEANTPGSFIKINGYKPATPAPAVPR